jgi:hypothetical protein
MFVPILNAAHAGQGESTLKYALVWTEGQPYLTQSLCRAAVQLNGQIVEEDIDRLVTQLFLTEELATKATCKPFATGYSAAPTKRPC